VLIFSRSVWRITWAIIASISGSFTVALPLAGV